MSGDQGSAEPVSLAALGTVQAPVLVREQAFERVRDAIITGQLPPGQRLIERELCAAMGISRTSVREVLRRLEAEKLVAVEPRKGPTVARLTREQAQEIYDIRAHLEGLMLRRFVERATDADIDELRAIGARFAEAAQVGDIPRAVGIMTDFYGLVSAVVRAEVVQEVLAQLTARVSYLRATSMSEPGRIEKSVSEISGIIKAVKRRDAEAAEQAAVSHVRSAASTALARLAP
ncbi:GntR family transcriptional regulator [Roseitranquillus sediminis]|uniref:GntR family transcriptional regulator n=1 Tax=Roseitranquillus sediminis TaxID=2809051 RepID=UPI001D0CA8DB|nr:GntR family transcriptional regulator [Roseitranquillus sediminis]MBM9594452.1 GntR family transcriptional regulator [Roseitranquillus sediminis]